MYKKQSQCIKNNLNLPTSIKIMILQLNPSILVETPLGRGQAILIIDYGMHQNTCWVVALNDNGVIKHFDCNDVIMSTNYTYGVNLKRNSNLMEALK
ncbi:MAG: hypothetical protein DDT42_01828 [candidate division WS2 bacterium]|uniref:Uncharacterized protein n=1 Tax=Psychracetigena formicireducens TaxID=2986056 RepID=A0A9E2F723_PSYF1|nr:hypothetical protein [Candidatus Psychracetigena formicireducens]